jgi:glutaredoxin
MRYRLFVRLNCHLCADAFALLCEMGVAVQRINIDRDPALRAQYDVLVPVLFDAERDRELLYPFDAEDVRRFMAQG